MRRNQIAHQTKEIFDDLGFEIGIQQEILDLEPPMIGEIRKVEELVAVTNEGVTEELPRLNDDLEDLDLPPIDLPSGLEEIFHEAERIRETANIRGTIRQPAQIVGPVRGEAERRKEVCAWYAC